MWLRYSLSRTMCTTANPLLPGPRRDFLAAQMRDCPSRQSICPSWNKRTGGVWLLLGFWLLLLAPCSEFSETTIIGASAISSSIPWWCFSLSSHHLASCSRKNFRFSGWIAISSYFTRAHPWYSGQVAIWRWPMVCLVWASRTDSISTLAVAEFGHCGMTSIFRTFCYVTMTK